MSLYQTLNSAEEQEVGANISQWYTMHLCQLLEIEILEILPQAKELDTANDVSALTKFHTSLRKMKLKVVFSWYVLVR